MKSAGSEDTQEGVVVAMADGYSRLSGKTGVCSIANVGLPNGMTQLVNTYKDRIPLLLVIAAQLILLAVQVKNNRDIPFVRAWTVTAVPRSSAMPWCARYAFALALSQERNTASIVL